MTVTSDETPRSGEERMQDALLEFTGCVGTAIEGICSFGLTIGEVYVPFDPDPDDECPDDEAICSQVWVRVAGVQPLAGGTEGWGGDGCAASFSMDLEVGILRCLEIPEEGAAPTATEVTAAAMQALSDMNDLQCAAMSCEVWEAIHIGTWSPLGPLGGQFGGIWTFTVEL